MLNEFTQEELIRIGIVALLAAVPAITWTTVILGGRKTSRFAMILAFIIGTLTVVPLILLYDYFWVWFPEWDVYTWITANIASAELAALLTMMAVGAFEEFAKSMVVRFIDKTRIGIQTINDSVKYSVLAGLGFAFTENIFYFYGMWTDGGLMNAIFPMIFRSIFTVCGHAVFSGIFGYYYGIAKFSKPILETKLWMGEKHFGIRILAKILGTSEDDAFRQITLLKGLFIAMAIHAAFNYTLEMNQFWPIIFIVGFGLMYLLYLLAHKAGDIVFTGSYGSSLTSRRDTDVVLELLGMWSREERYQDVIDICQRLLARDPENKVVQLFQAKAIEGEKLGRLEMAFTSLFKSQGTDLGGKSIRNLVRQKVLMEMLNEKRYTYPNSVTLQGGVPSMASGGPKIPSVIPSGPKQTGPSFLQDNL
ncbi:MAG: PrsW family intramembrane metalloprotease [Candidatus Gracilibacteria bacterium]|jgi:RsiW-degrading membrane proteinase PrsW (M82 family)